MSRAPPRPEVNAAEALEAAKAHGIGLQQAAQAATTADSSAYSAETPASPAKLPVLHDDAWIVAVHKPAGLLVHRTALDAQASDDLLTRLQTQLQARLWPAHRLDKGTSGVLLLARDAATAAALGTCFAQGAVHKRYLALVRGWPDAFGELHHPLARDPELPSAGQARLSATTRWQRLSRHTLPVATHAQHLHTRVALLLVEPLTGRRHQIRRHFKHLGHPLIGDATHGKGPLNRALAMHLGIARLWLHAQQLGLVHPVTGGPLNIRAWPGPEWGRWWASEANGLC